MSLINAHTLGLLQKAVGDIAKTAYLEGVQDTIRFHNTNGAFADSDIALRNAGLVGQHAKEVVAEANRPYAKK